MNRAVEYLHPYKRYECPFYGQMFGEKLHLGLCARLVHPKPALTLRDEIAMKASYSCYARLMGLEVSMEAECRARYTFADAMLKARGVDVDPSDLAAAAGPRPSSNHDPATCWHCINEKKPVIP